MVFLPADEVGGDAVRDFRLVGALAIGAEEETVRVEAERAGRGCNDAGNPNSVSRRRESRMTLGCVTQRLQMGTKTYLPHRFCWQGRERWQKR